MTRRFLRWIFGIEPLDNVNDPHFSARMDELGGYVSDMSQALDQLKTISDQQTTAINTIRRKVYRDEEKQPPPDKVTAEAAFNQVNQQAQQVPVPAGAFPYAPGQDMTEVLGGTQDVF